MVREISAGGVVLREIEGVWHVALIEPQRESSEKEGAATAKSPRKRTKATLALPKGLVDPGETAPVTAVREVHEETGIVAQIIAKLADTRYVYVRNWGDGEKVFKIVTFYVLGYISGEIDDVTAAMRVEVKRAVWTPLLEAARHLMYSNERKVLRMAQDYHQKHGLTPEKATSPSRRKLKT
ncbi:MAG: NUDIX domain-containing protein [Acidobacteria bacterium]|nr:NUDIX domain-containing protein [Acidobacteriota bacterium]